MFNNDLLICLLLLIIICQLYVHEHTGTYQTLLQAVAKGFNTGQLLACSFDLGTLAAVFLDNIRNTIIFVP